MVVGLEYGDDWVWNPDSVIEYEVAVIIPSGFVC